MVGFPVDFCRPFPIGFGATADRSLRQSPKKRLRVISLAAIWDGSSLPLDIYPLVNVYITMENHYFQWVKQLYMAMFNSYVKLPEGVSVIRSTMFHGKTHDFDWAMASSSLQLSVYQAGEWKNLSSQPLLGFRSKPWIYDGFNGNSMDLGLDLPMYDITHFHLKPGRWMSVLKENESSKEIETNVSILLGTIGESVGAHCYFLFNTPIFLNHGN